MKRFALQWQRCTKWRIAQMLRWAYKHILRISVGHWALGMDVIHSNTNENMTISIKGNVTKRMPHKWICCQSSDSLYHKPPLNAFTNQVEFKWIRLGLAAKWDKAVQPALRLATVQVLSSSWLFWKVFIMIIMIIFATVQVWSRSWLFHCFYHHHRDHNRPP